MEVYQSSEVPWQMEDIPQCDITIYFSSRIQREQVGMKSCSCDTSILYISILAYIATPLPALNCNHQGCLQLDCLPSTRSYNKSFGSVSHCSPKPLVVLSPGTEIIDQILHPLICLKHTKIVAQVYQKYRTLYCFCSPVVPLLLYSIGNLSQVEVQQDRPIL